MPSLPSRGVLTEVKVSTTTKFKEGKLYASYNVIDSSWPLKNVQGDPGLEEDKKT